MHKKRIKGKAYFYTSYRDETGKIQTKYLGRDEKLAQKREAEFKGIQPTNHWKLYLALFLFIIAILVPNLQGFLNITGASIFDISADPEAIGIYNSTPNFNLSLFGYGNYSDDDLDDSNGTSVYKWFVNGILNETGTTGQLLLCHFNNNYTCEEGETANITQYLTHFNDTSENINIRINETNSTLVYFNIPQTAIITEAFMNISGSLTSDDDILHYDSEKNATYLNPGTGSTGDSGYQMAGVVYDGVKGVGIPIESWFLLNNTPTGQVADILSIRYGNTYGTPSNGNFSYNIKICPTDIISLSSSPGGEGQTTDPDGNCTSDYIQIIDTLNLSANFSDTSYQWQNFTFNKNTSITFNQDTNFILKFEFVDGDMSTSRYWEMYLVDSPVAPPPNPTNNQVPAYVGHNWSTPGDYTGKGGNQLVQFYSKSRYPEGVEIDVGNDGDNEFADVNKSFDTRNTTADFTSEINAYLTNECSDTYCNVPINVSSNSSGIIGLEALRISYDHYDLDGKFVDGMIANYTYVTRYESESNIHNHNGTLDMWIKPYWAGNDNSEYTFFTDSDSVIQLNKSAGNNLIFYVDGNEISCDISTWTARANYSITATWNEDEDLYLYTNGTQCGTTTAPATISALGEFIFIGSDAENKTQANSTIDDLRITGFPRSPEEIGHYFSENRQFYQNEIFLNSTDTQIKREDSIIFEFTPVDSTGATGTSLNSSNLSISTFPPLIPTLSSPLNNTYMSIPNNFIWNNASDYDKEDTLYYILQLDDDPLFPEPVSYYNGSVLETADPTLAIVPSLAEGNYSWRVRTSDLLSNSSFTEPWYVSIDSTAPNTTLTSNHYTFVDVSSGTTESNITFFFNVSESNIIDNCTLNIDPVANPIVNQTIDMINQTENNFTQTFTWSNDGYNWSINCTDAANNINTTGRTILSFVSYENFVDEGRTTNFSEIADPTNVSNLTIENQEYGVINFTGTDLDLSTGVDIDSYITISQNSISIDDEGVPELNDSATLILFNLSATDIYVQRNSVNCTECNVVDSSAATYTFTITRGGTYTTEGNPVPPSPPPIPTGGSGGGGGTKTLTKTRSFAFDTGQIRTDQFVLKMKRNAPAFEKISITNDGDVALLFNVQHNLGSYLSILPEQFRLEAGDTIAIDANFYAGDPGIYTGKIIIATDTFQKIIPVTMEVRSEKVVVDAKLDIPLDYTELNQGDPLKAQVTLINTAKINIPIVISYIIKDLDGNVVFEEVETFDVFDEKSFVKSFDTSSLGAGSYITGMNVRYGDSFAVSSARFDVKSDVKKPIVEFKWYYIVVILSLFILTMFFKLRSTNFDNILRRKRRKLKKYEK